MRIEKMSRLNDLFETLRKKPNLNTYYSVSQKIEKEKLFKKNSRKVKIAILSSFTTGPLQHYLKVKCVQSGFAPDIYLAGYNLVQQEILSQNSGLYHFNPDILVISMRLQELVSEMTNDYLVLGKNKISSHTRNVIKVMKTLIAEFRKISKAKIILHNFETPDLPALGILDRNSPSGSQIEIVQKLNSSLAKAAKSFEDVFILDYEHLQSLHGKLNWTDDKFWYMARMPLAGRAFEILSDEYMKFIRAMYGFNRKCLILDLDNTLWGGILGEDGIDGIKLGTEYPGRAFVDFQREILNLFNRGIILAVNSKNTYKDALEVIEKHPYMLLRKKHFASMEINWGSKSGNIRKISEDLGISLDSMVFLDDDHFNCMLVRKTLPEVITVQLPEEPSLYPAVLKKIPYFDTLTFSREDRKRGMFYAAKKRRNAIRKKAGSLKDFLNSLNMQITIDKAAKATVPRISQLTNRTNQFNLTTRRYSEGDILRMIKTPSWKVYYIHLKDSICDEGIVSVAIIRENKNIWYLDTFLLSCRVIGRTVEDAFIAFLVTEAKKRNIKKILGEYIPSPKNTLAKNFFKQQGFMSKGKSGGTTKWEGDVNTLNGHYPEWFTVRQRS